MGPGAHVVIGANDGVFYGSRVRSRLVNSNFLGGWVEPYLRENREETRGGEPDFLSQKTYIYLCLCGL